MSLQRRTPLKVKTGFKRNGFLSKGNGFAKKGNTLKRTGKLRAKSNSESRKQKDRDYTQAVKEYRVDHPTCEFKGLNGHVCGKSEVDNHHMKGRAGKLLTDKKFFMTVCRLHHDWIHHNVALARERGYLLYDGR